MPGVPRHQGDALGRERCVNDQVGGAAHAGRACGGPARTPGLLEPVLAARLQPTRVLRAHGAPAVPADRLPWRGVARGRVGRRAQQVVVARARQAGLLDRAPVAAVDATGLAARHVSLSFRIRRGIRKRQREAVLRPLTHNLMIPSQLRLRVSTEQWSHS